MIIKIPINDLKNPPTLKLPERCANCGKPKEETLGLTLNMGTQKRGQAVLMKISVPMCKTCAEKERSITKVTLFPFFVGGLIFGAIAFVPAWLLSPQGTSSQTLGFPLVFGGFVALIVGIIFGTAVEVIVKLLATTVYGKLVMKRPLTIFGLFSETDELIGISAKFLKEKKLVQVEFENEEIAREFIKLNHLETK